MIERPGQVAQAPRSIAYLMLCLANLFWAGNWVLGRAMRDAFEPVALNFWRWLLATLILAPFAVPGLAGRWHIVRRDSRVLIPLGLTGVVLFQSLLYLGLKTTTAVNAVLLNSSAPLFVLLCSWMIEREKATYRQILGMLVSLAGILVILSRGEPGRLLSLDFHTGDAWILLAMPCWGIYSVLLKRRPPELDGTAFLFVVALIGCLILIPLFLLETLLLPPKMPTALSLATVVYVALFASVGAFVCWNRGVATLGANVAGFSMPLLPVFGTVLALLFLGETLHLFHVAGIATILAGVMLATRSG